MALWIKTTGEMVEVKPDDPEEGFTLEELYRYTNGGPIQIVRPHGMDNPHRARFLILNEEGKMRGLTVNRRACDIYRNPYDFIVGDVLLCHHKEVK